MSIDFDGVKRLRSVGGGLIKATWHPAEGDIEGEFEIDSYNVYIRPEDDDIFHREYLWGNVRNDIFSTVIRTEADRDEFLRNDICYYVGVNAQYICGNVVGNEQVKNMQVYGDGSESVEVPDRKITKVV